LKSLTELVISYNNHRDYEKLFPINDELTIYFEDEFKNINTYKLNYFLKKRKNIMIHHLDI